jgi:predicted phage terminase large subunit-like protein
MIAEADIKTLKVAKVKCLNSLLFFTRYFFMAKTNRKFIVGEHHKIISEALERVLKGQCKRLIINIAPRYGKTELAVKNFIAHGLALNPSAKFIHLSYSDGLALDNSEEIKDLINEEGYQQLFPKVQIKKDSRAKNKWYTTEGGGVLARSAAGQVTGFGAGKVDDEDISETLNEIDSKSGFGGAIIIDDPIKPEDADSDVVRERVNSRFDSTIRNRVNSRNTPIIVIMQRLHPKDLAGYLIEQEPGEWEVISLPCLFVNADGEMQALWSFKHTVDELKKLDALNNLVFARQYQQNPKPKEGLAFPEEDLNYFNPEILKGLEPEYKYMYVDNSDTGGDYTCAPSCELYKDRIYVPNVIFNKSGTDVNIPGIVETLITGRFTSAEIEGNSAWVLFAKKVRELVNERYEDCEVRIIKNTTNKHTRIIAMISFIKKHFWFLHKTYWTPEYRTFMQNFCSYMLVQEGTSKNANDDAADAMAGCGKFFMKNFGHLW